MWTSNPRGNRPQIVAVSGSRRSGSYTTRALEAVSDSVVEMGGSIDVIELADLEIPPLRPDRPNSPTTTEFVSRIRNADAIILGTPMYHGSYSGVLKNAIDHCGFEEFEGKTVGLVAVSGGPFPTPALNHLRAVCRSLRAWVLPHQVAIPQSKAAFDSSGIRDEALHQRVTEFGHQMVQFTRIEPIPTGGCNAVRSRS